MKSTVVFIFIFFNILCSRSQTIDGIWISTNSQRCIEFDAGLKRMNIDNWFEENWRTSKQRFVFKIKDDVLRITWFYYGKSFSLFRITYFRDNELKMTNIKASDRAIEELIGGYEVEFIKSDTCKSCQDYYVRKFGTFHQNTDK